MEADNEAPGELAHVQATYCPSEKCVRLGFQPEVPYYEITNVDFGVDLVRKALFEGTYRDSVVVPLKINQIVRGSVDEFFAFVVVSVQAVYEPHERDTHDLPIGCWNHPDWLVRGHLVKSPHDPYPEFIWVIALLIMDGDDRSKIDRIEAQLLRDGKDGARPW